MHYREYTTPQLLAIIHRSPEDVYASLRPQANCYSLSIIPPTSQTNSTVRSAFAAQKKKYKPVALKVRPLRAELPPEFRIIRNITGDPLSTMPYIDFANIPDFTPTGRYTQERMEDLDKRHSGFLWPEE